MLIKRSGKQKGTNASLAKENQSSKAKLVQLVSGSNGNIVGIEEIIKGNYEPFYGAMYLSLDGINSENMNEKVSIL